MADKKFTEAELKSLTDVNYADSVHACLMLSLQKSIGVQRALEEVDRHLGGKDRGERTIENWEEARAEIEADTGKLIAIDLFSSLSLVLLPHTLAADVVSRYVQSVMDPAKPQEALVRGKKARKA